MSTPVIRQELAAGISMSLDQRSGLKAFYILGEVNDPGAYPYRAGMTILNAAALAGGFTYRANEKKIEITRGGVGEPRVMPPETIVQPGDVIRVKERFF